MIANGFTQAAAAVAALKRKKLRDCLTWENLDSRPNDGQLEILKAIGLISIRVVRAGNQSGKGATAARDCSWFVNREHPYFDVDKHCGDRPLLILVAGQDRTQIEHNLWNRGIKPLLANPGDWKENRPSGVLASAENRKTGDTFIFISHNHGSEDDIKHMQSYAADYVWCDEMPKTPRVFEELTRRIDAKKGRFIITFTQKVRNELIRKAVDNLHPSIARLFRLNKLDNPLYADRKEEELAKISHLSPSHQKAILDGDWIEGDNKVFLLNGEVQRGKPTGYHHGWLHRVIVDPATESKLGLLVVAYDPMSVELGHPRWWVVHTEYVEGIYVPSKIVAAVEEKIRHYNIHDRRYDPAASWYAHQAREMGYNYLGIPEKTVKKSSWISETQEALGRELMIAEWCDPLWEEMSGYERSETNPDKIVAAQKYHLIDCLVYHVATTPHFPTPPIYKSFDHWVHASHAARQKREAEERRVQSVKKHVTPLPGRRARGAFRSWR